MCMNESNKEDDKFFEDLNISENSNYLIYTK